MNACMEHLPPPLAKLLDELQRDHAFGHDVVAPLRQAFAALDREGDANHHALECLQCLALIAAQPRSARDRFEDIGKVLNLRGKITVTLPRPV